MRLQQEKYRNVSIKKPNDDAVKQSAPWLGYILTL